jgi:hypothetical protein
MDPITCARLAQDGTALFLAGLQSDNSSVSAVFAVAVSGCILAMILLAAIVIGVIVIKRNPRMYSSPPIQEHSDYMVPLSEAGFTADTKPRYVDEESDTRSDIVPSSSEDASKSK